MTANAERFFLLALAASLASGCGANRSEESAARAKSGAAAIDPPAKTPVDAPPAPVRMDDVSPELGVHVTTSSGMTSEKHFPTANGTGVGMFDFDLDGWMDVFVCQGCRLDGEQIGPPCSMLQSRRSASFTDVAKSAGLDLVGYSAGVSVADANGDGFPDVHLTRVNQPFRFFINNGDGTYSDRSAASGLNMTAWGTSAAWFDYDNDGNPDLYVCNYGVWDLEWHRTHPCVTDPHAKGPQARMFCGPPGLPPAPHFLFRSLGDGRFVESAKAAGVYREGWPEQEAKKGTDAKREWQLGGRGQGVVAVDLNNDCRVDLYVANDLNENFTFLNVGGGKFRDVTTECLAGKSAAGNDQAGMGVDGSDFDGDGLADLFVTNFYMEYSTLYHNLTDSPTEPLLFEDVAERSGVAAGGKYYVKWGTSFEDLDGDGRLDLFVVNGHVDDNRQDAGQDQPFLQEPNVWRNMGNDKFEKLTQGLSPFFSTKFNSRGAAFGDLFNDGQVHVVVSHRDQPLSIVRNRSRSVRTKPYSWTQVQLVGTLSSRDAVGARIEVHCRERVLVRHIRGGRSYLSAHDPRLTIGLGEAEEIAKFVVHWPSGAAQEILKPEINRSHVIREKF